MHMHVSPTVDPDKLKRHMRISLGHAEFNDLILYVYVVGADYKIHVPLASLLHIKLTLPFREPLFHSETAQKKHIKAGIMVIY